MSTERPPVSEVYGIAPDYCDHIWRVAEGRWLCDNCQNTRPDPLVLTDDPIEARIRVDFEKHPGSWRGDPEGWFREGWIAGYTAGGGE